MNDRIGDLRKAARVGFVGGRVHNTGQRTLEMTEFGTFQFDQHLRANFGLPLAGTATKA